MTFPADISAFVYYPGELFDEASRVQTEFLKKHL